MKLAVFRFGVVSTLFASLAGSAYAETYSIDNQLRDFRRDPRAFAGDQRNVRKYLQNYSLRSEGGATEVGAIPSDWILHSEVELEIGSETKFSRESLENRTFVEMKNVFHEGFGQRTEKLMREGRAMIDLLNDNPEGLVGTLKVTKLKDMEGKLQTGRVEQSAWSGDYWAIYAGGIAKRYLDPSYPASDNWKANADYLMESGGACSVDQLSPAEKYDLLVGDENKTLTKRMLAEGQKYFELYGKVETWMGICHGWAPAAFREKRPVHAIDVVASDGTTKIKFYPSDIKALASLLWANTTTPTKFIGQRCQIKDPPVDPENGRIKAKECFDTNPGTWHQVVVNQIGVKKRSFALDATFDYEIWNQPAYSYEYTYFNPKTNKSVARIKDAIVSLDDSEFNDVFHKYRDNPDARSVVGIAMKFTYIAETRPSNEEKDSAGKDRRVAVNYLYDLELDADGKIIGGEWYHQQHPDFLWAPNEESMAMSVGDLYLKGTGDQSHWHDRGHHGIPEAWKVAAVKSSSRGQPLGKVVRELIQKSNQVEFLGLHLNLPGTVRQ